MSFNLVMQALVPDVQQKIFEEVSRVLPDDMSELTDYRDVMSELVRLSCESYFIYWLADTISIIQPYTRAAVNEALRLWPSA